MEKLIQQLEKNGNIEIHSIDTNSVFFKYCASGSYATVFLTGDSEKPYELFSTDIRIEGYNLKVKSYPGYGINSIINQYK